MSAPSDQDNSPERPVATVAEVYATAGAIRPWYRAVQVCLQRCPCVTVCAPGWLADRARIGRGGDNCPVSGVALRVNC